MKVAPIEVTYVDHMGTDLSVVNAARVSFDKESEWLELTAYGKDEHGDYEENVYVLREQDRKLIKYLAKHKHYSPFNHTFITVRVKAPVFVARQLVKHEYMPWNEISRRYVDSEPEFYDMPLRMRAENVKQGSLDQVYQGETPFGNFCEMPVSPEDFHHIALDLYADLLRKGVAPEIARGFLPHTLMTEWYWSGTLKAFHKMLDLRLAEYTQADTRIVAQQIRDIIEPLFPVSLPALLENK